MPTLEEPPPFPFPLPLLLSPSPCINNNNNNNNNIRSSNPIMIPTFRRRFPFTTSLFLWAFVLLAFSLSYLLLLHPGHRHTSMLNNVRYSAHVRRPNGISVLVTGAAGFIGSHVAIALKTRGDGVVGIDNFDNYYGRLLKETRRDLLELYGVYVVEGDINDSRLLSMLFYTVEFTHVMHLAAQVGVQYAIENPYAYVRSNIASLVTLLDQCKLAHPQPAVVWASSSSVYGVHNKAPYSETDRVDPPDTLYASTKRMGEEITRTYNRVHGLSITGLRFFTVYGPWGRPDMAYFSYVRNILEGDPITIYRAKNRVDPAREFVYIDDIVKGCVASLDTSGKSIGSGGSKNGSAPYRIFNLGNGSPVTVPALVAILEEILKTKVEKEVVDMGVDGDASIAYVNISLAERELGYKPTTDLRTGLREFVKWYLWYHGTFVENSDA